jgi:hypothetical protein
MERENLHGDAKGKGASGYNHEADSTDAPVGADCLVVVMKRGNARGAKGAGHRHWRGSTGNGRNPLINERRQPSCDGTSRISREAYVRFCERLEVKFLGPTRQQRNSSHRRVTSVLPPNSDIDENSSASDRRCAARDHWSSSRSRVRNASTPPVLTTAFDHRCCAPRWQWPFFARPAPPIACLW